jgi:hypothetical protein
MRVTMTPMIRDVADVNPASEARSYEGGESRPGFESPWGRQLKPLSMSGLCFLGACAPLAPLAKSVDFLTSSPLTEA